MKKTVILITLIASLMLFSSCNYNGKATIIVKNVGPLTIMAIVEYSQMKIFPGGEETFKISWPGHDDTHINLITYPTLYRVSMGESLSIWIKNGETKTYEISYYPPDDK